MTKKYDLAVVGAGPSGLMAAKTAAEKGLSVILFERNREIAPIKRGCGMVLLPLNDPYFGEEKIYLDRSNGRISFTSSGFSVPYEGPSRDLFSWHILSPGGKVVQFGDTPEGLRLGENARTSAVHDKSILLSSILQQCEALGVKISLGTNVVGVKKMGEKVRVCCEPNNVEVPFVIAADGVNSRLAQDLRMNAERMYYGLMKIQGVEIRGVKKFDPNTFYSFVTGKANPTYNVLIPIAEQAEGCFRAFTVVFDPDSDAERNLNFLLNESRYAASFKEASTICEISSVEKMFSPMETPYRDQVLFVGDTAWCQEIEITAALMCGWHAGNAIASALNENKISSEGISGYLQWWNQECLDSHDHSTYLRNYALCFLLTNEEIDYLFDLIQVTLPALFNPYRGLDVLGQELAKSMDRIQREKPEIAQKLQTFSSAPIKTLMGIPIQAAAKL
jgi:flavin-dependent dehydrogenase